MTSTSNQIPADHARAQADRVRQAVAGLTEAERNEKHIPRRPFGPQVLQAVSRDVYVDNETDTDQWEIPAQVEAICEKAASLVSYYTAVGAMSQAAYVAALLSGFTHAAHHDNEPCMVVIAQAILSDYHDMLWSAGEHPYYDTLTELTDFLTETED